MAMNEDHHEIVQPSLTCLYTNARTLSNKMLEMKGLVENDKKMVIGITEINPTRGAAMTKRRLHISNYKVFIASPNDARGACLYIHNDLNAQLIDLNAGVRFRESVWVEVDLKNNTKVLIGCVYRRSKSMKLNNDALCTLIAKTKPWSHVLVMGDFNYPGLVWTGDGKAQGNAADALFLWSTQEASLTQHIRQSTTKEQNQQILDLVFSRDSDRVNNLNVSEDTLGNSDHYLISFEFTAGVGDVSSDKGQLPVPRSLTCLYTNAGTLSNKMDRLAAIVHDENQMVIGITEINPTRGAKMTEQRLHIANYKVFIATPNDRRGACLYIHESLEARLVDLNARVGFHESVWVEVDLEDSLLLVGCIYRSPKSQKQNNDCLRKLMAKTKGHWSRVLVMGDFNYPELNWTDDGNENAHGMAADALFLKSTKEASLTQYIRRPTMRWRKRILDLVFSNARGLVRELNVSRKRLGKSDHVLITFTFTPVDGD